MRNGQLTAVETTAMVDVVPITVAEPMAVPTAVVKNPAESSGVAEADQYDPYMLIRIFVPTSGR